MKTIKTLVGALALSAFTAAPALADTVRLGTEGLYPPYNFINDNGEIDGFERELGDELCSRAELECTWVTNDWDSIIPNLVASNYDVIIAGMSINDERDEAIDFSNPYVPPSSSFYVALADTEVDVNTGVITAQTNTLQSSHIASSGATLVEYPTPDETISAVRNGEADAVLADGEYLAPIVSESNGELVIVEEIALGGGVALGIRESDGELREKFNVAIDSMKEDGTLNELLMKWFPENAPQW